MASVEEYKALLNLPSAAKVNPSKGRQRRYTVNTSGIQEKASNKNKNRTDRKTAKKPKSKKHTKKIRKRTRIPRKSPFKLLQ